MSWRESVCRAYQLHSSDSSPPASYLCVTFFSCSVANLTLLTLLCPPSPPSSRWQASNSTAHGLDITAQRLSCWAEVETVNSNSEAQWQMRKRPQEGLPPKSESCRFSHPHPHPCLHSQFSWFFHFLWAPSSDAWWWGTGVLARPACFPHLPLGFSQRITCQQVASLTQSFSLWSVRQLCCCDHGGRKELWARPLWHGRWDFWWMETVRRSVYVATAPGQKV